MEGEDRHIGITRRGARWRPRPTVPPARTFDLPERVRTALSPVPVFGLVISADPTGVVTLDGAVRTNEARLTAERLTREVTGVTRVTNRLIVDPLIGEIRVRRAVSEPELAAEIALAHLQYATPTEERFTRDIGTTDTAIAADEAQPFFPPTDPVIERAPREAGGYEIVGGFAPTTFDAPIDLEQLPHALLTGDDEIAREVRLALKEDAATSDLPIHVTVRRRVVHLRGVVPSLTDAELAEAVAWRVPGVLDVQEELEIEGLQTSDAP
ncbi:MAG: BON domain-containing protein [Chloroflexi bacterium]|nr:BON domain-containing protein [Chloroflexota bacterium]